jgi:mRNA interferase RelE/StbE
MLFEIFYDFLAINFLDNQEKILALRIIDKIEKLKGNPVPSNSKRIKNSNYPVFRIRIGKYRALYRINYKENRIIIFKINKRSKVYD